MKKIFFKTLLALGAVTIPLAGGAALLASCTTATKNLANTEAAKYWVNFLDQNHGRWTGNISNFKGVKDDNTGFTNDSTTLTPLNPLESTTVSGSKENNFGSYHAYEWILNEVTKMGYTNNTPTVSRPAYAKINTSAESGTSKITAVEGTTKTIVSKERATDSGTIIRGERSVIYNNPSADSANLLLKTGIVTQGFLWSGNDRGNGVAATYNNVGSNLIVTVNPNESITTTTEPYDFWIVAHYDSTAKTGVGQSQASWGATDNATSVAVNLALLKYFSNKDNAAKLKTRLHIVFADAEEVGVLGSNALVRQYLDASANSSSSNYPLLASSWGMVNMDTVAGGDFMYVHSSTAGTGNKSTAIRDALNKVSKSIATSKGDSEYELAIHKQHHYKVELGNDYNMPEGETGDWSDHAPFYQIGNIPVAYFESTNFDLQSKTSDGKDNAVFDGYSQTRNKYAWITWDHVPVEMVEAVDTNGEKIWVLPEGYTLSDFLIGGDIWHSDIDTPNWLKEYIGYNKIFKQLDACYEALIEYLTTVTPQKYTS